MSKDIRHRMSVVHEGYVATLLGGVQSPGSGNQAASPMDGRQDHHRLAFAFAWDAKATLSASISVSLAMWEKAKEQTHGERPCLPLRFYETDRLERCVDLVVLDLQDFAEIVAAANAS